MLRTAGILAICGAPLMLFVGAVVAGFSLMRGPAEGIPSPGPQFGDVVLVATHVGGALLALAGGAMLLSSRGVTAASWVVIVAGVAPLLTLSIFALPVLTAGIVALTTTPESVPRGATT